MTIRQRDSIRGSRLQLAIVCPCYNESEVLRISIPRLVALLKTLVDESNCDQSSYVVLVDDGSRDNTWEMIEAASQRFPEKVKGVKLSRNAGHQYALMSGLTYVNGKCDIAISLDVDLQDDLRALPKMISEYRAGSEIVLGVKLSRAADSWGKRFTAKTFYRGMKVMGVDLVENHADCRLLSSKALKNLAEFPEYLLFLRGLQPLLHNKISTVSYDLEARLAGQSKYNLKKMLALAWNGITSFSIMPLRLISWTGALVFAVSCLFAAYALIQAISGHTLPGWASITIPLYLLGGLLMLSIGIVGEYVGKIFLEVKNRPRYLVDEIADYKDDQGADAGNIEP